MPVHQKALSLSMLMNHTSVAVLLPVGIKNKITKHQAGGQVHS